MDYVLNINHCYARQWDKRSVFVLICVGLDSFLGILLKTSHGSTLSYTHLYTREDIWLGVCHLCQHLQFKCRDLLPQLGKFQFSICLAISGPTYYLTQIHAHSWNLEMVAPSQDDNVGKWSTHIFPQVHQNYN